MVDKTQWATWRTSSTLAQAAWPPRPLRPLVPVDRVGLAHQGVLPEPPTRGFDGMIVSPSSLVRVSGRSFRFCADQAGIACRRADAPPAVFFPSTRPIAGGMPRKVTRRSWRCPCAPGSWGQQRQDRGAPCQPRPEGPSLGGRPSGTWTWISHLSKRGGLITQLRRNRPT